MAGCFLDTTILVEVAEEKPAATSSKKHVLNNQPAAIAEYAFRELFAGRVALLCNAHNKILASDNVVDVAVGFLRQAGFGRTPITTAQEILAPLSAMFSSGSDVNPGEAKRQILEQLMLTATKLWRNGTTIPATSTEQPLACFSVGSLSLDGNGILRGPNGSFSCSTKMPCSAAQYLYERRADLRKMIAALEADDLPEKLKTKQEIRSRKNALKLLESRGPDNFNKRYCRALGDAYFAAMCPPGSDVLTTNIVDFLPICSALGKRVTTP